MLFLLHKRIGLTPLQCLENWRSKHPHLQNSRMTYAGRLDPMAEGLLIVLSDEDISQKKEILSLPKEYELEIVFGLSTDTYDILGLLTSEPATLQKDFFEFKKEVEKILPTFVGKFTQKYPPYSSKTVSGKPLFQIAKDDELEDIDLPTKEIEIFEIQKIYFGQIGVKDIIFRLEEALKTLKGDFRQAEIVKNWQSIDQALNFPTVKIKVKCSSGTYMRSLAVKIGDTLGMPALALYINRLSIGDYML